MGRFPLSPLFNAKPTSGCSSPTNDKSDALIRFLPQKIWAVKETNTVVEFESGFGGGYCAE